MSTDLIDEMPLPSPDEPGDLTNCDREPIHIPNSIQPHGMLIAARGSDLRVAYVSANSMQFLHVDPAFLLARTLPDLLGKDAVNSILAALGEEKYFPASILTLSFPLSGSARFDVLANRVGSFLCVEMEPAFEERRWDFISTRMETAIRELRRIKTVRDLCSLIPPLIRSFSGYDRVMVYRFDADGHGDVIGEAKDPDMESFLGLHYPASDIPQQARRLYLLQRIRTIVDMAYRPVRVLGHPSLASDEPLDMTYCGLRSVSPIHVEYLQNMGVGASLGISLIHKNELWGMVICHHRTAKRPTQEVRALCDSVGQLVSLLIGSTLQTEDESDRQAAKARLDMLSAAMECEKHDEAGNPRTIGAALAEHAEALLGLVGAEGALIRIGRELHSIGSTPGVADVTALSSAFHLILVDGLASSNEVGALFPPLANLASTASGALKIEFSEAKGTVEDVDTIMWVRGEAARTVNWAGNPDAAKQAIEDRHRLSPRKSFALWKQIQRGRALPWLPSEIEAARGLQQIVTRTLLQRSEGELTRLSYYDGLTGLPNRRALLKRLAAWQNANTRHPAALLFLDLDNFNAVNDSMGHAAGDEMLKQIGARLTNIADGGPMVARLGGDEFAIFCENASIADGEMLANAILTSFREPYVLNGKPAHIKTSIGVAPITEADATDTSYPLRVADSAMYIAKQKGGYQVVVVGDRQQAKALRMQIAEDVMAREMAAKQLKEAYAELHSVMECTSDGVLRIGRNWVILFVNRKAQEEIIDLRIGRNFWDCFPGVIGTDAEQHLRATMMQRVEKVYETKYGPDDHWLRIRVFPTDDGIGLFFSNCTEEKTMLGKLEVEQLLREKRVEALSHMAGGLAHEISNPLAIIHGRASDLKARTASEPAIAAADVAKACDSILQTSDRAIRILRGLRGFAREAGKDPFELASIYEIIEQCMELQHGRAFSNRIEVQLDLSPNIPLLQCRETQIGQIVTNLLNNAFDVIVQSQCVERWVSLAAACDDDLIYIDVCDSGPGIDDRFKPHLMEPFFTTKEFNSGMGIGLSLSRAIAQDHGGTLTLRDDTEHTCFRLVLPLKPADEIAVNSART